MLWLKLRDSFCLHKWEIVKYWKIIPNNEELNFLTFPRKGQQVFLCSWLHKEEYLPFPKDPFIGQRLWGFQIPCFLQYLFYLMSTDCLTEEWECLFWKRMQLRHMCANTERQHMGDDHKNTWNLLSFYERYSQKSEPEFLLNWFFWVGLPRGAVEVWFRNQELYEKKKFLKIPTVESVATYRSLTQIVLHCTDKFTVMLQI